MRRMANSAKEFLKPLHVVVGTKCGPEAILHAVRRFAKHYGHDNSLAVLKVYFLNAFN